MQTKVTLNSVYLGLLVGVVGWGSPAATITAVNLTQTSVQSAINASQPGDTILMPAGAATWTAPVTLSANRNLQGAGMNSTFITDQCGAATALYFRDNCR